MDIKRYKRKQLNLYNECDITYISNYTKKVYPHETKFIIPNSITYVNYKNYIGTSYLILPNSVKYYSDYTYDNNGICIKKHIINYATKFICIKNFVYCDDRCFQINKNLEKYSVLNNIFIQNLCIQNNTKDKTNKTKITNVFLLENITSIMIGVFDYCTMKNMYSFKNIKYVTLVDSLCQLNTFLFKNIKMLQITHEDNKYLDKLCILNVCIFILYNFSNDCKMNLTNIKYFKNIKTIKYFEYVIFNNIIFTNTIYIKNVRNIIIIGNQCLLNIDMLKNTHILIIYLQQDKRKESEYKLYLNSINNFKCKYVEIFKCNILPNFGYKLLHKNANKYFGEEY